MLFRSQLSLKDGEVDTPWVDFANWKVFITDTNDYDYDGVPDFTDPPASAPATVSFDGWGWYAWPWVYSDADKDWLYYYSGSNGWAAWRNKDKKWYAFNAPTKTWTTH